MALVLAIAACDHTAPSEARVPSVAPASSGAANRPPVITDESQRDAAVGREVVIVGIQTRTKMPTVCGIDVDGAYALSDKKVVVRGVLHRHVVTDADQTMTANRGNGTFYSVVDPATGRLAKPSLAE